MNLISKQPGPTADRSRDGVVVRGIIYAIGGLMAGGVIGLIIGANIGGNWATGISIGSQHGYEATALLGALIGGIGTAATSFWLTVRRRSS